jgi:hypothetical protein
MLGLAAVLLVFVGATGSAEGRNALFDDGGASARETMPFHDYSFGDSGDDEADTMGAVYHMSQAEFQRRHSDFKQEPRTALLAKAAHDFDANVLQNSKSSTSRPKPSALAQGMAKETKKLQTLNLDEATEVAAVQAQREDAAVLQAKTDSNLPGDLMEDASVQSKAHHRHQRMQAPVSWHEGGQDSANQGMVASYNPRYKIQEKRDAADLAAQTKKGKNLLVEQTAPHVTDPWDPSSMIQLDEHGQEHEKMTLAASNAAFERRLENVEQLAHEQDPLGKKKHAAVVHVVPLDDAAYQHKLDAQAADNAKFESQLKRVEDLAKPT